MADATISNTLEARIRVGNHRIEGDKASGLMIERGVLTFDGGNYATGGIAWEPEFIDPDRLINIFFETSVAGWQFHYIPSTGLLTVWNGTTEYTNSSAISVTTKYRAEGY